MLRRSVWDATTDSLSGLANRRALMADLERVAQQARMGVAFTVVFFDLNGFKGYNDSFGHAAGDALLARLGGELQVAVAGHGHAYRLGGDEFCVLLRGRHSVGDHLIAAAAGALVERGSAFRIGVSLGVAVIPDDARSATTALQLADERMYINKPDSNRAGRAQASSVLMALLGERTPELRDHVSEVTELVRGVAAEFRLDAEQTDELLRAADLHDVGKLAIPDAILGKSGPLNDAELQFMRQHPVIGERILSAAPALVPVAKLVRSSHERWDGTGYPDGLKGTEIPLATRILAVCDAFEAMTADRCYRRALARADAVAELQENAGTQFDPAAVQALCRWLHSSAASDSARRSQAHPPAAA
jgi:two-component system, cell cycle response regulator